MTADKQSVGKEVNTLEGGIAQLNDQLAAYKLKLADSTKNLAACEEIIKLGPSVKWLEFLINDNNTVTKTKIDLLRRG